MGWFKPREKEKKKVGGLAFFASLTFLALISINNLVVLPTIWGEGSEGRVTFFIIGAALGVWLVHFFVPKEGNFSTLIHEYKHAILATLVGNKWKKLKVKGAGGKFSYAYTKETAGYNAFISLAPYYLLLFTIPTALIVFSLGMIETREGLMILGFSIGCDQLMCWRDVSPVQTDLTSIRGGYRVAVSYVVAINIALVTIIVAWVIGGLDGLAALVQGLWDACATLYVFWSEQAKEKIAL